MRGGPSFCPGDAYAGTMTNDPLVAHADHRLWVFSLSRNCGHQIALSAGLDVTIGSAVVMMDADLQHPPALIPEDARP